MSRKVTASKNVPDWIPSEDDYELVFCEVGNGETGCFWRECSHNIPKYSDMLLSDYLSSLGLCIPDYTQFLRICAPDYHLEYRAYGGRVRIDYEKKPILSD